MINNKTFFEKYKSKPIIIQRLLYVFLKPRSFKHMLHKRYGVIDGNCIKGFIDTNLMFVHIPKCAGISLNYSLYNNKGGGHVGAYEYFLFFGKKKFSKIYKFAVVRNPWDRVFSAYTFLKKGGRNENDQLFADKNINKYTSFEDFVLNWINEENIYKGIHFIPQYEFVCDANENIIMDHIAYFENLDEEYNNIITNAKTEIEKIVPKKNLTNNKIGYKDSYSLVMINHIAKVYQKDIEMFDYEF